MLKRLLVCSLLLPACPAQSGTVLEMVNRDLRGGSESTAVTYAQDGKLRIETGARSDPFAIFRDETLYAIDPQKKTYKALDRAEIKRLADQINPALKMLQQHMASMPPETRAQMERMLGGQMPQTASRPMEEIRKTSRTETIAGYKCSYAQVLQDGVVHTEACVVPAANLEGGKELYDAVIKVGALLREMIESIESPSLRQVVHRELETFDKLGGIPVLTRSFDGGQVVRENTLKSIKTQALADDLFEIPAGYTKQELPGSSL